MSSIEDRVHDFEQALLAVDRQAAKKLFENARASDDPFQIIESIIIPTLDRIGKSWEKGEIALSQVYMSGRICEELINAILPSSASARIKHPRIAIAVFEDYHILGKRIILSILRSAGFDVLDLGHGVTTEDLINTINEEDIELLLISTLMLPSALKIKELTKKLRDINAKIKIVVGGAPFNFDAELWKEVEADAYGYSGSRIVDLINQMGGK